jgi:hypothetical protein
MGRGSEPAEGTLAALASTNTWNVYNNFGGRSNYINPGGFRRAYRERSTRSGSLYPGRKRVAISRLAIQAVVF